jgi:hypothetical protein
MGIDLERKSFGVDSLKKLLSTEDSFEYEFSNEKEDKKSKIFEESDLHSLKTIELKVTNDVTCDFSDLVPKPETQPIFEHQNLVDSHEHNEDDLMDETILSIMDTSMVNEVGGMPDLPESNYSEREHDSFADLEGKAMTITTAQEFLDALGIKFNDISDSPEPVFLSKEHGNRRIY